MAICETCGKKTVAGRQQTHHRGVAGKRWKNRAHMTSRVFKPNLQRVSIVVSDKEAKVVICTKCLKRFKKEKLLKSQQKQLANYLS